MSPSWAGLLPQPRPQGDIFTDAQREDLIQRMGVACARPAQAVIEIGMKAMKKWLELRKNE